jgi:N-acetylmuramoyl-L-alanine amidase
MLLVRKVEGPATAHVGARITYRATKFNRAHPTENEKRNINWVVKCDGEEIQRKLKVGDAFAFKINKKLVGKTIVAMPFAKSPTLAVSAVTLIQPAPELRLREQLAQIRSEFADILTANVSEISERVLVDRIKNLTSELEDLLDTIGPLEEDAEDDGGTPPAEDEPVKRLAIIVGHTELRQGAFALAPISQHEYSFNREIAQTMEMAAASKGIAARTFFRDGVGIQGAYQAATAFEPDSIIELHFNSASAAARGTETLCSKDNPDSKRLADLIQKSMVGVFNRTGSRNRGVKVLREGDRGFGNVSAAPSVPSVLVEPFFGSNAGDCQLAFDRTAEYAAGLVDAFAEFAS